MHAYRFILCLLVAVTALIVSPGSGLTKSPGTTISGGDLPYPIRLPFQEDEAFWHGAPLPFHLLPAPPAELGSAYTITSWFWAYAVKSTGLLEVNDAADYYPAHGIVRITQGDQTTWLPFDPDSREVQAFWAQAAQLEGKYESLPNGAPANDDLDLLFTLPERRMLSLTYIPSLGTLVDRAAAKKAQNPSVAVDILTAPPVLSELLAQPSAPERIAVSPESGSERSATATPPGNWLTAALCSPALVQRARFSGGSVGYPSDECSEWTPSSTECGLGSSKSVTRPA